MDGTIIEHTNRVAAELSARFRGDPEGELEVWVSTAQQREAMVVQLYDAGSLDARLPPEPGEPELNAVVRKAVGGIWAQESSHTTLMNALRSVNDERLTVARSVMGAVEGKVAQLATSDGWLGPFARLLISFGRVTGQAPEFTQQLRGLGLRDFCRFSHELELTASHGYARIIELIDQLDAREPSIKLGVSQRWDFEKTLREERFHAAVFEQLQVWLNDEGTAFDARNARESVLELRGIASAYLGFPPADLGPRHAPRPFGGMRAPKPGMLVSDGGLGALFDSYGVGVSVAPMPQA
jgi:hypothetical protein